jgi:hypothetical protein
MIYSKLTTSITKVEFDSIYTSSEPYLVGGNYGESCTQGADGEWYIGATSSHVGMQLRDSILLVFQQVIESSGSGMCAFELRETGTDWLLSLKVGYVNDGTFTTLVTLMNPNSNGSLSWIYHPPSDAEIEELMVPTGIKRILMTPIGANFIAMCENTSVRVTDADNGNRQYRSTWGWDNYETDLVDM